MPELPEVETVARGLSPALVGARLVRVELRRANLRFAFPERFGERLCGQRIVNMGRRAKYLLVALSGPEVLVIHLGMSGHLALSANDETPSASDSEQHGGSSKHKHDHVVFHFGGGTVLTYNDPRRFGFMDLIESETLETHRLFAALGPEPLGNSFNADDLATRAHGRKTNLKAFLLDQRTVAGLGNIYVCEALYRAGISPLRAAHVLSTKCKSPSKRAQVLVPAIRDVLERAIKAGGSSLKDFKGPDGVLGYFQHTFDVYGRTGEACRRHSCSGVIRRITQAGRSTFYCPHCQR